MYPGVTAPLMASALYVPDIGCALAVLNETALAELITAFTKPILGYVPAWLPVAPRFLSRFKITPLGAFKLMDSSAM